MCKKPGEMNRERRRYEVSVGTTVWCWELIRRGSVCHHIRCPLSLPPPLPLPPLVIFDSFIRGQCHHLVLSFLPFFAGCHFGAIPDTQGSERSRHGQGATEASVKSLFVAYFVQEKLLCLVSCNPPPAAEFSRAASRCVMPCFAMPCCSLCW